MSLRGLFLNTAKANCSIHESGKMAYDCLNLSRYYSMDYQEICKTNRSISLAYDFYVFNYHEGPMRWLDTKSIKNLPGIKATLVLEVAPNNPFVMCPKDDFDIFIALDPTLYSIYPNVYPFPRPIEVTTIENAYIEQGIPIIGTFGFATNGKGFDKVIDAVNKEFDEAVIRINIPRGDYVSKDSFEQLNNQLKNHPTKKQVKILITNDFLEKNSLIRWCMQNTLNVFLYNRNIQGLAATTDQAITCGRPLAISTDNTFRHIHSFLTPYPFQSLKESIQNSKKAILAMQKEWFPQNFSDKFESILKNNLARPTQRANKTIKLPLKTGKLRRSISKRFDKAYLNKIKKKVFKSKANKIKTLQPFVHYALNSFSQFQEDLFIDLIFNGKKNGFYLDVGANDPSFNSNTKRFYLRGWRGINIEPNAAAFKKITQSRHDDLNINAAISEREGELIFYNLSDDTTLSTLDYPTAKKMAMMLNLTISTTKVKAIPLRYVLDRHLNGAHIDFMSVDSEGHDLTVLKSNDWNRYRPSIVMVESNNEFEDIRSFMDNKDYMHIYNNFYNAIFVDKHTRDSNILNNLNWNSNTV